MESIWTPPFQRQRQLPLLGAAGLPRGSWSAGELSVAGMSLLPLLPRCCQVRVDESKQRGYLGAWDGGSPSVRRGHSKRQALGSGERRFRVPASELRVEGHGLWRGWKRDSSTACPGCLSLLSLFIHDTECTEQLCEAGAGVGPGHRAGPLCRCQAGGQAEHWRRGTPGGLRGRAGAQGRLGGQRMNKDGREQGREKHSEA